MNKISFPGGEELQKWVEKERIRLMVKASKMYYIDGLNQVEISKRLRKSRSQISRLLAAAKAEGYVQVTIRDPFAKEHALEDSLVEAFDVQEVVVTHAGEEMSSTSDVAFAQTAAQWLGNVWQDDDVVGVMAGKTLNLVAKHLTVTDKKNLQFVPLIGGWGKKGVYWDANSNTRIFGERLKSKIWQLNAPAIVNSKETKDRLLAELDIMEVLTWAKKSSIALIGIGQVSDEATIVETGYISRDEIQQVQQRGAIANICTTFLNQSGQAIGVPFDAQIIGLSGADLRKIPYVVGIARGLEKVPAIFSTLKGGWLDVLITDQPTAEAILAYHQQTTKEEHGK